MRTKKLVRVAVLTLLATCFAACHFHGGHCHGIDFSWSHCRPHRHCR